MNRKINIGPLPVEPGDYRDLARLIQENTELMDFRQEAENAAEDGDEDTLLDLLSVIIPDLTGINFQDLTIEVRYDLIEMLERQGEILKVSDLSEVSGAIPEYILLVNDHGNMSLYAMRAGELTELWSVV